MEITKEHLLQVISGSLDYDKLDSEKPFVAFIKKHSHLIFGEEIRWNNQPSSKADLEGKDSNNNLIIVEAKWWYVNDPSNMNVQEHRSVGQIIQYASKYLTDHSLESIRLFIVGTIPNANVENSCEFLRSLGLNIQYVSASKAIATEVDAIKNTS